MNFNLVMNRSFWFGRILFLLLLFTASCSNKDNRTSDNTETQRNDAGLDENAQLAFATPPSNPIIVKDSMGIFDTTDIEAKVTLPEKVLIDDDKSYIIVNDDIIFFRKIIVNDDIIFLNVLGENESPTPGVLNNLSKGKSYKWTTNYINSEAIGIDSGNAGSGTPDIVFASQMTTVTVTTKDITFTGHKADSTNVYTKGVWKYPLQDGMVLYLAQNNERIKTTQFSELWLYLP
ncbi:MAG TPA: hypothetical protein PKA00_13910 [Saprospiraceae bacterium]|nr:hypothetical protein [Saprospiraceae bacterium]